MTNGIEINVSGNLGSDIELRYSDRGTAWATFNLAVSESRGGQGSDAKRDSSWLSCKVFGDLATNLAESVGKGAHIMVSGKYREERWKDQQSGENRSRLVLNLTDAGPSLKWAQATISKTGGGGGNGGGYSGGGNSGGGGYSGGGQAQRSNSASEDPWGGKASSADANPFDSNEDPFS